MKLFGSSTWNMLESVKSRVAVSTTVLATRGVADGGATAILKSARLPPETTTCVTAAVAASRREARSPRRAGARRLRARRGSAIGSERTSERDEREATTKRSQSSSASR